MWGEEQAYKIWLNEKIQVLFRSYFYEWKNYVYGAYHTVIHHSCPIKWKQQKLSICVEWEKEIFYFDWKKWMVHHKLLEWKKKDDVQY